MRFTPVPSLLVLCLALPCFADDVPTPTPEQLLRQIEAEQARFDNRVIFAVWQELTEGKAGEASFEQTWTAGDGRTRIAYQRATWDPATKRVTPVPGSRHNACVYDGQVTVDMAFNPNANRLGQPPKEGEPRGYRTALVYDGLRRDNFSLRDPFRYAPITVTSWIRKALDEGQEVTVERAPSAPGAPDNRRVYRLTYPDPQYGEHSTVTIDADRGWTIWKIETFDAMGATVRTIEITFERDANGQWVPASGSHKHYGKRPVEQGPLWEWRFTTTYARRNDPKFDYTVFDILLEPDTAVSDIRFGVAFRTGEQPADVQTITDLAQREKAKK